MSAEAAELLVVAVPAAVGSAASFGLASAMQQRATKKVPTSTTLDPRLFFGLIRQPGWVLGVATVLVGLGLQIVALAYGPLVLIQPLLVTGVLFGTVFSALLAHRALDWTILLGACACAAGLATFLSLARPVDTSTGLAEAAEVLPLALVLATAVFGCLLVGMTGWLAGGAKVYALALATGVLYGVTAGLLKLLTEAIRSGGVLEVLTSPVLYVICIVGPIGFLLSQNTFQQGLLIAPALAIITIVDPLVGFAIGVSWLGERVETSAPVLAGATFAVVVVMAGIALLAWRGTQIRHQLEAAPSAGCPDPRANVRWG